MPIIMYRAVTSMWSKANISIVIATQMKFLKRIKEKKDKRERLRNRGIREFTDKHLGTQISKYQKKVVWTYFNNQ
jgi:hypothetical protein